MLAIGNRSISIIVVYSIVLHLTWAVLIWCDSASANATAVDALYRWIHPTIFLSLALMSTSLMAMTALTLQFPWSMLLLLPQQAVLCFSAAGAIEAIYLGQFADGVLRSHFFIAADQIYAVLTALGHTVAIILHALRTSSK